MSLFNTVSEENELECNIRKQINTRCQIGKKIYEKIPYLTMS
jgi:hypothetical protein